MKKSTRLIEIQEIIASLVKEYSTATTERKKQIKKEYHALNQEHCNMRATAYKTAK